MIIEKASISDSKEILFLQKLAYNLLRKVDPTFSVYDIMEGVAVHGLVPKRLSISDLMSISYENLGMSHRLIVGDINIIKC